MEKQEIEGLEWRDTEKPEEEDPTSQDRFTDLMFGPRRENTGHNNHRNQQVPSNNQINYEELMMNIDNLMESVRGLKPLLKKMYPFIEQLWKKK